MDENKEVISTDPKREKVRVIPLSAIDDAPDHPFGVRDDEEMAELVESISTFGVINPVIVRKGEGERYELISGHRRKYHRKGGSEMVHMIYLMFICIGAPLLLMLFLLEKQSRVTVGYMILGIVMCLFAGEVNALLMQLLRLNLQYAAVSLTPITEEIIKALPVLFYAFVISEKWERLLSLSMALGIGFAIMENVYVVTQNIESADVLLALIRGFATGLMHGICTATVGYGISFVRKCKKLFYTGTFGLLLVAVIYHGIFNTLVQSPYQAVGFFMPIVTYIPVVVYIIKKKIKIK